MISASLVTTHKHMHISDTGDSPDRVVNTQSQAAALEGWRLEAGLTVRHCKKYLLRILSLLLVIVPTPATEETKGLPIQISRSSRRSVRFRCTTCSHLL
jgi:hypothetical protein